MKFLEEPKEVVNKDLHVTFQLLSFFLGQDPYWIVEFSSEDDVKLLANRSVSLRSCMELWASAKDIRTLHENLKQYPKCTMESHFHPNQTFKIEVETFCKHISQQEKVAKIEVFFK